MLLNWWQIIEEPLYLDAIEKLGDVQRMDEIVEALLASIATNPMTWPAATRNKNFRVAYSDPSSCLNLVNVPHVAIYYKVVEETGCVHLYFIEEVV